MFWIVTGLVIVVAPAGLAFVAMAFGPHDDIPIALRPEELEPPER
jgi:hypothetical protein